MQCPKCHGTMELIVEPEASAHRCTRCKGLWFEMMAHETLKHRAEEIDTGDPAQGEECNKVDRIKEKAAMLPFLSEVAQDRDGVLDATGHGNDGG